MSDGYIRQSTFTDGDVVDATELNGEFNALADAFDNSTGHAHDGTAANGPVLGLIGDAGEATPKNKVVVNGTDDTVDVYIDVGGTSTKQVRFKDGVIEPETDNDVDLGSSSKVFRTLYADSATAKRLRESAVNLTISAGAVTADWSAGTYFNYTNNAAHTLTFTNVPTNGGGYGQSILIAITNAGAYSLSISATGFTLKRPSNVDSLLTASGVDVLLCTVYGKDTIVIVPLKNLTTW